MSRTTYRLFDGMTLVSTAVKCMDGSIQMSSPYLYTFHDINAWKSAIENINPLSLSTHETFPIDEPNVVDLGPIRDDVTAIHKELAYLSQTMKFFDLGPIHDDITAIHTEVSYLSQTMNVRMELLDIHVKALLQKLD